MQHEELADEPVRARDADAAQRHDRQHRGEHRHDPRDAAVGLDQSRVAPLVDHADQEEQRAGRDAVVDHDHQRALHALHGQREDAEHHEAEVADRRVGDELLEVRLHERHERAVDDADHREHEDRRCAPSDSSPRLGKERHREAQEAERTQLQHDARKHHRAAVGASTCASGSQVWNGNIGTFTANARKNAPNSQYGRDRRDRGVRDTMTS